MKTLIGLMLLMCSGLGNHLTADTMQTSIQDVKERHEARLLSLPGVVSVGIGLDDNKQPVIIVGMDRETDARPAQLPNELEGYPVKVQNIGTPRAR